MSGNDDPSKNQKPKVPLELYDNDIGFPSQEELDRHYAQEVIEGFEATFQRNMEINKSVKKTKSDDDEGRN